MTSFPRKRLVVLQLVLATALAGCSTAAMDDPINFAVACRTDIALNMAKQSISSASVLDRAFGQVAELAILKDAGRAKAYRQELETLLAEHESMSRTEVDEAVDTKVAEMRQARAKATGQATC